MSNVQRPLVNERSKLTNERSLPLSFDGGRWTLGHWTLDRFLADVGPLDIGL